GPRFVLGFECDPRTGPRRPPLDFEGAVCPRRRLGLAATAVFLRLWAEHPAWRASVLQLQLRRARRLPGQDRQFLAIRAGGADLYRHAPDERRTPPQAGVWQARRDRVRRLGWRRRDHLPRRQYRFEGRYRGRKRRHEGYPGRRVRRRQSMPRHPSDRGITALAAASESE